MGVFELFKHSLKDVLFTKLKKPVERNWIPDGCHPMQLGHVIVGVVDNFPMAHTTNMWAVMLQDKHKHMGNKCIRYLSNCQHILQRRQPYLIKQFCQQFRRHLLSLANKTNSTSIPTNNFGQWKALQRLILNKKTLLLQLENMSLS